MARFAAFDVETPNRLSNRMSAIGISVIEDGAIVDEYYSLVNPETHFDYFNTCSICVGCYNKTNSQIFKRR